MSKKVITNNEILNELNKLRAEVASIKSTKINYTDVIIDDADIEYTFSLSQLMDFVERIQEHTTDSINSQISMMDFSDCVNIHTHSNTIVVDVDADDVASTIEYEKDCEISESDAISIYHEVVG